MAKKRKIDVIIIVPDQYPKWKFWKRKENQSPSIIIAEQNEASTEDEPVFNFFVQAELFASVIVCENFSGSKSKLRVNLSPDISNSFYLFLVTFLKESCGNKAEYRLILIDSERYETEQPLVLADVASEKTMDYAGGEDNSCRIMLEFVATTGLGLLSKGEKHSTPKEGEEQENEQPEKD